MEHETLALCHRAVVNAVLLIPIAALIFFAIGFVLGRDSVSPSSAREQR